MTRRVIFFTHNFQKTSFVLLSWPNLEVCHVVVITWPYDILFLLWRSTYLNNPLLQPQSFLLLGCGIGSLESLSFLLSSVCNLEVVKLTPCLIARRCLCFLMPLFFTCSSHGSVHQRWITLIMSILVVSIHKSSCVRFLHPRSSF